MSAPETGRAKGGLLRSTAVFSAMTLLSRIAGFARDVVQAQVFGAGGIVADAEKRYGRLDIMVANAGIGDVEQIVRQYRVGVLARSPARSQAEAPTDAVNYPRALGVGFAPATDIRTGIGRFVEWYREYYKV